MSELTEEQKALLEEGKALIAHCPVCRSDHFLGRLPMPVDEVVKLTRKAKCPVDPKHKLLMGPIPEEKT